MKIPKSLLPFLAYEPEKYSQEAIRAFHSQTGAGNRWAIWAMPDGRSKLQAGDLLDAHSTASRCPSGILEGVWADGYSDYPIRVILQDMIRECLGKPERWLRKLPLFERAYRFSVLSHSRSCYTPHRGPPGHSPLERPQP